MQQKIEITIDDFEGFANEIVQYIDHHSLWQELAEYATATVEDMVDDAARDRVDDALSDGDYESRIGEIEERLERMDARQSGELDDIARALRRLALKVDALEQWAASFSRG